MNGRQPAVSVNFDYAAEDVLASSCDTRREGVEVDAILPGDGYIDLKLGPVLMEPNVYDINATIFDSTTDLVLDTVQRQRFILNEQVPIHGLFGLPHEWGQPRAGEHLAGEISASSVSVTPAPASRIQTKRDVAA